MSVVDLHPSAVYHLGSRLYPDLLGCYLCFLLWSSLISFVNVRLLEFVLNIVYNFNSNHPFNIETCKISDKHVYKSSIKTTILQNGWLRFTLKIELNQS